jgi:hypothetical protein
MSHARCMSQPVHASNRAGRTPDHEMVWEIVIDEEMFLANRSQREDYLVPSGF